MLNIPGLASIMMTAALLAGRSQTQPTQTLRIDAPVQEVYALAGMQENKVAQFVVETELPSSCFTLNKPSVRVNLEQNAILFHLDASERSDIPCSVEKNSVIQVIKLGKLPAGDYEIRELKSLRKHGSLKVLKRADALQASNQYADIESATIHKDALGYRRLMTIMGYLDNSCAKLEGSASPIVQTSARVIEVAPILQFAKSADCHPVKTPFVRTYEIPETVGTGKYLFHVVGANEQFLNRIDTVYMDIDRPQAVVWDQKLSRGN